MNSLFITGSTGFIGRHLIKQIRTEDYDGIYCLQRSPVARTSRPPWIIVPGDIRNPESYTAVLEKCSTVVHLAAATGKARPADYFEINADGTRLLVQQCKQKGVRNFLFVSTIAVKYQSKKNYYYAESKEAAEETVKSSKLHFSIIRPTIVLGKESVLWKKLRKLVTRKFVFVPGTGRTMIQPVDVDDLCSVLNSILQTNRFSDETMEVGGPDKLSFQNFLEKIHASVYGGHPSVLRIPIKPLLPILSFLEKFIPSFPIGAGQFSAFLNDGTVDPAKSDPVLVSNMKGLDQVIKELSSHA